MITDYYNVTTDPTEDPITVDEAKAWARIRTAADDDLVSTLISSVTLFGEKFTNRVFITRTIEGFFSGIEVTRFETVPFIRVRRAPLLVVSKVEVFSGGAYVAFTDYKEKQTHGFSLILFESGIFDSNPDLNAVYPLKVTFTAGYGAAAEIPKDIKTALKAHFAFLYENRGDVAAADKLSMPLETKSIYTGKYQIVNTFG